jgi:high-affinity Fe2+/Pb2+ permease
MSSGSPRNTVRAGIMAVAAMSFLMGIFLMVGIREWAQGDPLYIAAFLLLPVFVAAAVMHARRMLKAVP